MIRHWAERPPGQKRRKARVSKPLALNTHWIRQSGAEASLIYVGIGSGPDVVAAVPVTAPVNVTCVLTDGASSWLTTPTEPARGGG
jgi:hypothetical protein